MRRAVAALTVIGSVVLAGGPAGSADRHRGRERSSRHPRGETDAERARPVHFVAEIGGRIAVVSADTGRVERHLTADTAGGGAEEPTVDPDGRTVWFSRGDGPCAAHLASVPLAGGDERKVPDSGEAGPEGAPLPRPGRDQLAFARADCDDPDRALVVGDLGGLEAHGQIGLVPLAWSRDGEHLLARSSDGGQVHLLDIDPSGAIVADRELDAADRSPECQLEVVGFSPDDNNGYVAVRRCGPSGDEGRRSLVLLDKKGGFRRALLRLPRGQDLVDRLAFDATGHSLLYSSAPAEPGDGAGIQEDKVTLWLWRDDGARALARHSRYRHPSWMP